MDEGKFGAQRLTDDELDGVVGGVAMVWDEDGLCTTATTGSIGSASGASRPMSEGNQIFGSIVAPAETSSLTSLTNGKR